MFDEHDVDTEGIERKTAWTVLQRLEANGNLNLPLLRELYRDARRKGRNEMADVFARWGIMIKVSTTCLSA